MMQDWADRLDLFEQNLVEAASMPLTIHLEGVPVVSADEAAANEPRKPAAAPAPILIVTRPGDAMPLVSAETHRLPAVPLPRSVMEEPLSDIQRQRMELVDVFEAAHNLPVAVREDGRQVPAVDQLRNQGRQPIGAEPGQPRPARAGLASRSGQARADPVVLAADQGAPTHNPDLPLLQCITLQPLLPESVCTTKARQVIMAVRHREAKRVEPPRVSRRLIGLS
jgi:hypothetical protein